MFKKTSLLTTAAASVICVGASHAEPIEFDINQFRNDVSAPSPTGWTPMDVEYGGAGGSVSATDSGVTVTLNVGNNQSTILGRLRELDKAGPAVTLDEMFNDFAIRVGEIDISGLDPNGLYNVSFIMYDDDEPTEVVTQTVFNTTGGGSDNLGSVFWDVNTTLTSDTDQRLVANGLQADGSGNLTFGLTADGNGGNALINGIIVEVVPEPGSLALLGLGGLLIARRRR